MKVKGKWKIRKILCFESFDKLFNRFFDYFLNKQLFHAMANIASDSSYGGYFCYEMVE